MSYQWGNIDHANTENQFFVDYLDHASSLAQTQAYKRQTFEMLQLEPGQSVLDLGCGAGEDLLALARIVGPEGSVVGIDNGQVMVDTATERTHSTEWATVQKGSAEAIPFPDAHFDACRADRVFIHLADPELALDELCRVLRPGGYVLVADPAYDTVTLPDLPRATARALVRYFSDENRNPTAASSNKRLFSERGLQDVVIWPHTAVFHDFATADQILGIGTGIESLVAAGQLSKDDGDAALAELMLIDKAGTFLCAITGFATVGRKPITPNSP